MTVEHTERVGWNGRLQQVHRSTCGCGWTSRWTVSHWLAEEKQEAHDQSCEVALDAVMQPGQPGWFRYMTASKVAAVLGVSPYQSPRSLWHLMRGDIAQEAETKAQSRGHYLEPAILAWWWDQHRDWPQHDRSGFVWLGGNRLPWGAARPDAVHVAPDGTLIPVEAKTSADDSEWGTPGTDEIPVGYAAQCIWTCHVLGAPRIFVPVLTARLEFREYVVEHDPVLAADMEARCAAFMRSLHGDTPPPVDSHPETYRVLRRVNPLVEQDSEVELDPVLAARYAAAVTAAKAAEEEAALRKSQVMEAMGTAQRAVVGGEMIARRQTSNGGVALYAARKFPHNVSTKVEVA